MSDTRFIPDSIPMGCNVVFVTALVIAITRREFVSLEFCSFGFASVLQGIFNWKIVEIIKLPVDSRIGLQGLGCEPC